MPQGENKIRKVLFNEVTAAIALIGLGFNIFMVIKNPMYEVRTLMALIQKDIEIINTNHISHIQDELAKKTIIDDKQNQKLEEIGLNLERIITLLEKQK